MEGERGALWMGRVLSAVEPALAAASVAGVLPTCRRRAPIHAHCGVRPELTPIQWRRPPRRAAQPAQPRAGGCPVAARLQVRAWMQTRRCDTNVGTVKPLALAASTLSGAPAPQLALGCKYSLCLAHCHAEA